MTKNYSYYLVEAHKKGDITKEEKVDGLQKCKSKVVHVTKSSKPGKWFTV